MPNYKRYEVCSPWLLEDSRQNEDVIIVLEVADLKDKQTGDVFSDGAFRVRFVNHDAKTKVWFGETAHSDGHRYLGDAFRALLYGKEVPAR